MSQSQNHCICEICTCGRHKCPHEDKCNRVMPSAENMGLGSSGYSQEYAAKRSERPLALKPQSNLKVENGGEFEKCSVTNELYRQYGKAELENVKQNSIRQSDNIRPGTGKMDGTSTSKNAYAKYENAKRASLAVKPSQKNKSQIFSSGSSRRSSSSNLALDKRAEKSPTSASRSNSANNAKFLSIEEKTTIASRNKSAMKNQSNDLFESQGKEFSSMTEQRESFLPKSGDRYPIRRVSDQLTKFSKQGQMSSETVNSETFKTHSKGDRFETHRPKANIELSQSTMAKDTDYTSTFKYREDYERSRMVKPVDQIEKSSGELETSTVNRETYTETKGDRFPIRKPRDNLKQEGLFDARTVNGEHFVEMKAEKVQQVQHHDNLHTGNERFHSKTVNRETYCGMKPEELVKPVRPKDNLHRSDGEQLMETSNQSDFKEIQGDRMPVKIPKNNIHVSEDKFATETSNTDNFRQYDNIVGKLQPVKPKNEITRQDGPFETQTTNKVTFLYEPAEKVEVKIPANQIHMFSGEFGTETTSNEDFKAKTYGKVEPVRPQHNLRMDEGAFDARTTSHEEFVATSGDRYDMQKPKPNLTTGQGAFDHETTSKAAYLEGKGERFEMKKPRDQGVMHTSTDADFKTVHHENFQSYEPVERTQPITHVDNLRNAEGSMAESTTTNKADFMGNPTDRVKGVKHVDNLTGFKGDQDFRTVQRTDFQQAQPISRTTPVKPLGNLKMAEGKLDTMTVHRHEFRDQSAKGVESIENKVSLPLVSINNNQNDRVQSGTKINRLSTGQLQSESTNRWDHQGLSKGDRADVKVASDGTVNLQTSQRAQVADKVAPVRPGDTLPKMEHHVTTSMAAFQGKHGDVPEAVRPRDAIVKESGSFDGSTVNRATYVEAKGERMPTKVAPDNLSIARGSLMELTTVSRETFRPAAASFRRPVIGTRFDDNVSLTPQGHFEATSVCRSTHSSGAAMKRCAGSSDMLAHDVDVGRDWPKIEKADPCRPKPQIQAARGPMELSSAYSMAYTPKSIAPCIAGKLIDSVRQRSSLSSKVVDKFLFSHRDRGHLYFSENS